MVLKLDRVVCNGRCLSNFSGDRRGGISDSLQANRKDNAKAMTTPEKYWSSCRKQRVHSRRVAQSIQVWLVWDLRQDRRVTKTKASLLPTQRKPRCVGHQP
jgi:hypothetical protein